MPEVEPVVLRDEMEPEGRWSQAEPKGWRDGAQRTTRKSVAQAG